MLEKCRNKLRLCCAKLRFVPGYYIFTVSVLLICAFIIRLSENNTHIIYSALDNRGFFPGPFGYTVCYFLRLCLCAILLAYCTFSRRIYEERVKAVALSLLCAVLMLLEYKLIFGGVSLVLALFFTVLSPLLSAAAFLSVKIKEGIVGIAVTAYIILQAVFLAQLISLSLCI